MQDFLWEPDTAERYVEKVRKLQAKWAAEDDQARKRRARAIAAEIEADRIKQAKIDRAEEAEREMAAEIERRKAYWERERKAGAAQMEKLVASYQAELDAAHAKRLKVLAKISRDIERDKLRAEREALLRRNVVGGRRK